MLNHQMLLVVTVVGLCGYTRTRGCTRTPNFYNARHCIKSSSRPNNCRAQGYPHESDNNVTGHVILTGDDIIASRLSEVA